jgi:radical SAM superfamily enzyme YgiQ (UPF0313 family)
MALEKKRLVLINPVSTYRKGFSLDLTSKFPPLGLAILAAHTPSHWKIRIIDEHFQTFRFREADLVGITSFTASAPRAYEIAKVYRDRGIKVVMGGIHASMCPDEALNYVDSVVIGEGESVWGQVLEDQLAGNLKSRYYGQQLEMKGLPEPRHDLLDPRYVFHSVQTSRGCPMDCDFCSVTSFNGQHYRLRPVEEILDELEHFRDSGKALFFVDDNIAGISPAHHERAISLFKGMVERGFRFEWLSQTSLNIARDDEVLKWAGKSGCKTLLIGIESETLEGLESATKKVNIRTGVENYKSNFRKINKHGIAVLGTFIFALESDSAQSLINRARYIRRSGINAVQATILTPMPGTPLYRRISEQNRLACTHFPDDWKYYHVMDIVFDHPKMTAQELASTMKRCWGMLYNPLRLVLLFLKTWYFTRSLRVAVWSYDTNIHYRNIVFEREIHHCGK